MKNYRWQFFLLLATLLTTSGEAWCYDFMCKVGKKDILYFTKLPSDSIEQVEVACQEYSPENYAQIKHITIPNRVTFNDTTYIVAGIGNNAFAGAKNLRSVSFEYDSYVSYIGEGAFAGCQSLRTIDIPPGVTHISPYTFAWSGIERVSLKSTITNIGERAFSNCSQLRHVQMSGSIDTIDNFAFAWCGELRSFAIPLHTRHLGYEILQACASLDTLIYNARNCLTSGAYRDDNEERTIGPFEKNNNLTTVIFGDSVESIPPHLFYNCYSLNEIIVPDQVKHIGAFAFHQTSWYEKQLNNDSINYTRKKPKPEENEGEEEETEEESIQRKTNIKDDIIFINDIAYSYVGSADSIVLDNSIRTIAPYCFYGKGMSYVEFDNIEEIGESAFENCDNLSSIRLSTSYIGNRAFADCDKLADVKFVSVDSIGSYAFSRCGALRAVRLAPNLSKIGDGAFYRCEQLEEIAMYDKLDTIPAGIFSRCVSLRKVVLPSRLKEIKEYAFAGCYSLDSIAIPSSCTSIGSKAFSHCFSLNSLSFGRADYSIGPMAFYSCTNLSSLSLNSVTRIGYKAFCNCQSLRRIDLGQQLEEIAPYAFQQCEQLEEIRIPSATQTIGRYAFEGCLSLWNVYMKEARSLSIGDYAFSKCKSLFNLELGQNVHHIGQYAFSRCEMLQEVSLPYHLEEISRGTFSKCYDLDSVSFLHRIKKIDASAFDGCAKLRSANLPDSVEIIGDNAFRDCESLTEISLPDRLSTLGKKAFMGCRGLKEITVNKHLETIGDEAFSDCANVEHITYNAANCATTHTQLPVFSHTSAPIMIEIGPDVERIDRKLFSRMNFESVSIPNRIKHIGHRSFADNPSLANVEIAAVRTIDIDNTAFENTPWLRSKRNSIIYVDNIALRYQGDSLPSSLSFREGTTAIAAGFMKNNKRLTKITLPESLITIGNRAFEDCSNLEEVYFPEQLEEIQEKAFARCEKMRGLSLPHSLLAIGDFAFERCLLIDTIDLHNAAVEIGHGAFYNCAGLRHADIGNNVEKLGRMAFAYCAQLKTINSDNSTVIPERLRELAFATFFGCSKLRNQVVLPNELDSIGPQVFEGCKALYMIDIAENLQKIDATAFNNTPNFTRFTGGNDYFSTSNGMLLSAADSSLIICPTGISGTCVVSKRVTSINQKAFYRCDKIRSIRGMRNVEAIADEAFAGCTNLRSVSFGAKVRTIGKNIFEGCINLENIDVSKQNTWFKSVDGVLYSFDMQTLIYCPRTKKGTFVIPRSVTTIADRAFENCMNLDKIVKHKNIVTVGKDAFTGCKLVEQK